MNTADKPPEDVAQELEVPERLPEEINPDILRKYFTLTASDLEQVEQCRGPINRLGFAVQLCTLRWRGHFLGDTRQVPESVLATIASQLGLDPTVVSPGAIWTEVKPGFPPISSSKRPHGLMTCSQISDVTAPRSLGASRPVQCGQRSCRRCHLQRLLPARLSWSRSPSTLESTFSSEQA